MRAGSSPKRSPRPVFFSLPLAVVHTSLALTGLIGGLVVRGDVALPTAQKILNEAGGGRRKRHITAE